MFFFSAKDDQDTVCVVSEYNFLRRTSHDAEYSRAAPTTVFVFLDMIVDTLIHSDCGDIVRVVVPYRVSMPVKREGGGCRTVASSPR